MFTENMASRTLNIVFFSNELQGESKLHKTEAVSTPKRSSFMT